MTSRPGTLKDAKHIEEVLKQGPRSIKINCDKDGNKTCIEVASIDSTPFVDKWEELLSDDYSTDEDDYSVEF